MGFISYTITTLLAFSGLIGGIIVSLLAKEELQDGQKYFILLQKALLVIMLFVLISPYNLTVAVVVSLISTVILHFYTITSKVVYPFLAVILALSYGSESFFTQASLIFLYGLPSAAVSIDLTKKKYYRILVDRIVFIVVALLLFSLFL